MGKRRARVGRVAVLSAVLLASGAWRAGAQSSEPNIIDHPGQFSSQGRSGDNCTWALSYTWDVWNNTGAPYALTSVTYRGFWEVRDGPNDYHVPITVDDGGFRAGVVLHPGVQTFQQSATLTTPCNAGWFGVIVNADGPYGFSGGSVTWGEFVNGVQVPISSWQAPFGLAAVLGVAFAGAQVRSGRRRRRVAAT